MHPPLYLMQLRLHQVRPPLTHRQKSRSVGRSWSDSVGNSARRSPPQLPSSQHPTLPPLAPPGHPRPEGHPEHVDAPLHARQTMCVRSHSRSTPMRACIGSPSPHVVCIRPIRKRRNMSIMRVHCHLCRPSLPTFILDGMMAEVRTTRGLSDLVRRWQPGPRLVAQISRRHER